MDMFEEFCKEYNIVMDFTRWNGQYEEYKTHSAFIIFKYSGSFIKDHE